AGLGHTFCPIPHPQCPRSVLPICSTEPTRSLRIGKWLALALLCDLDEPSLLNKTGEASVYFSTRQSNLKISFCVLIFCCLIRVGTRTTTLESSSDSAIHGYPIPRRIRSTLATIWHSWLYIPVTKYRLTRR